MLPRSVTSVEPVELYKVSWIYYTGSKYRGMDTKYSFAILLNTWYTEWYCGTALDRDRLSPAAG